MPVRRLRVDAPVAVGESVQSSAPKAVGRLPVRGGDVWWPMQTVDGAATLRVGRDGNDVVGEAWGPGAWWVLERLPDLVGLHDEPATFAPPAGTVRELHRRRPGLRMARSGLVFQTLLPVILGQRITAGEAHRSYRDIVHAYGEPAPGPIDAWAPPAAATLSGLGYADLHPFGVERSRASIVIEAARRARRLETIVGGPIEEGYRTLMGVRGIGIWTAAIVMGAACGDPDAVPLGDYHIPNTVAWALAGEPRGDDARMVELLEPYAGHRRRVVHLLQTSGISAPRYGPKTAARDLRLW